MDERRTEFLDKVVQAIADAPAGSDFVFAVNTISAGEADFVTGFLIESPTQNAMEESRLIAQQLVHAFSEPADGVESPNALRTRH